MLSLLPFFACAAALLLPLGVESHGTMVSPTPRQPESIYWYQVGCAIGCKCSGGGKETYPSLASLGCEAPAAPTLEARPAALTWNIDGKSPRAEWNKYMPWRAPGTSIPLNPCGIASGFDPKAGVQYPHRFKSGTPQGTAGTALPEGFVTYWKPGATVEASYRLAVNHGGGYQWRVCPKKRSITSGNQTSSSSTTTPTTATTSSITNECFEQNPLAFADSTTTLQLADGRRFPIDAVDVSEGVVPANKAWRRLPLPACACDIGTGCNGQANATRGDYVPYNASGRGYGHCTNGLQFSAKHLTDGTAPDFYGYYVAGIGADSNSKKGGGTKPSSSSSSSSSSKSKCGGYVGETACTTAAAKEAGCKWYASKSTCYLPSADTGSTTTDDGSCSKYMDSASCKAAKACTWYEEKGKTVCYGGGGKRRRRRRTTATATAATAAAAAAVGESSPRSFSKVPRVVARHLQNAFAGIGTSDTVNHNWVVVDKLIAPADLGDYILQWRWDNEQTPVSLGRGRGRGGEGV